MCAVATTPEYDPDVRDDVPRLMGPGEVAEALGIKQSNLYGKNRPKGLPEPIQNLKMGPVWIADEVEAFASDRASRKAG